VNHQQSAADSLLVHGVVGGEEAGLRDKRIFCEVDFWQIFILMIIFSVPDEL